MSIDSRYPAISDAVPGDWKARSMRNATVIRLSDAHLEKLHNALLEHDISPRIYQRIQIVLAANKGFKNQLIASMLSCSRRTVGIWRQRVAENGIDAILAASFRPGRRPVRRLQVEQTVLHLYRNKRPQRGTRWTIRSLAAEVDVSKDTVQRILRSHQIDLKESSPH